MANLLQSLQESQQGYQQHNPRAMVIQPNQQVKKKPVWPSCLALVIVPSALTAVVATSLHYRDMRDQWLATNSAEVELVQFSKPILHLEYPDVGALRDTQQELVTSEPKVPAPTTQVQAKVVESEVKKQLAPDEVVQEPQDDLLEGIDLSTLPPDIAQRFQAAMYTDSAVEEEKTTRRSSELTADAKQWYGKLPALNFQTHVYSSNPSKRWVKVNGVEYQEGDWLTDGVKLVTIEAQACVVNFTDQHIRIPALYDWQG